MQTADWRAAQQIEQLFHLSDCTVWELREPEQPPPDDSIVIRDGGGEPVAYARPAS
ncbi:MAG TPA: hypothetical protein VII06_19240 [Chloroflexota bacterium]|jgi:hypothetical protein